MYGELEENSFTLDKSRNFDIPRVTQTENDPLIAPFIEKEVTKAIFDIEHNKAPNPDGFSTEFYQKFWEIIKGDLMQMFHGLFMETCTIRLELWCNNFIPKIQEENVIQQYRPICLLNVSFKIFTKVATIRLNSFADRVLSPCQMAFMRG